MSDNHLKSLLGLLRLLKRTPDLGLDHAPYAYLERWCAPDGAPETILRVLVYIQAQISGAEWIIGQSDFVDEGKAGLMETITALRNAFSLPGVHTALRSHLPALDSSISQFAILVSVLGVTQDLSQNKELADLISSVEKLAEDFAGADIEPSVRATVKRHLHVLLTLLRNVDVMGVEAAMAAYAELVIRLQSEAAASSVKTQEEVKKFWPTIETWAKRLNALQKIAAAGHALGTFGKPLLKLITG